MTMRSLVPIIALVAMGIASGAAGGGADGNGGPAPGVAQGWDGVVSRDGKLRYVAMTNGSSTLVSEIRTQGGRVARWGWVKGGWGIPIGTFEGRAEGLSRDGRSLLLASVAPLSPQTKVSRFAVISTKNFRVKHAITLKGSFAYDALSPDMRTLYLLRYLPSTTDIRYQVRAYDLQAGALLANPIIDKSEPDEQMQGQAVSRATSANGGWVMTLYATAEEPFVHALDTLNRSAVCIDLPWKNATEAVWKIRLRVDGNRLVLEQRGGVKLAVVDMKTWKVTAFRRPA